MSCAGWPPARAGPAIRRPARPRRCPCAAAAARGCRAPAAAAPAAPPRRTRLRKARALRASSTTQCDERRGPAHHRRRAARRRAAAPAAPRSSAFGTSTRLPRALMRAASGSRPASRSSVAGADQRQADQRGRVVGVDRFEQRDAQRLALGAAGAVVGLLQAQVALDLALGQGPEAHPHRRQQRALEAGARSQHGHARSGTPRCGRSSGATAALRARGCRACRSPRRRDRPPGRSR